ncbi:ATP-binding protein [Mucilaginibacter calamicampi]|uniref:histidine kinase n=1 Tax=Mucilaginibacter calamicampi TaxID=1302352 RepID=A0ABW2Z0Q4_9SPHI
MNEVNTSILIIDDEEMVRDNIADILMPQSSFEDYDNMNDALDVLFDAPKPILATRTPAIPIFTVDKASNGTEGIRMVKKAVEERRPYAVIFLDMRMPGISGLEAAVEIRKHDMKVEIIFITAYSDRSIDEIVEQAGQNVGYHCKPYAPEEIIQIATKAVTDYNKLRNLEKLIESISTIGLNKNQLNSLLKNILDQLAGFVDTDIALIGKLHDNLTYEKILSIGALENNVNIDELIARVQKIDVPEDEVVQIDELFLARMDDYIVFAILKKQERLKVEKMYLLRLFVQNAAQAIRNAELNEKLIQNEKLSAVGQVIGMVMHDLRSPIKSITTLTDFLRRDGVESQWVGLIDQCAEQASEIFDDFLDFIRNEPVKKSAIPLLKIVKDAVATNEGRPGLETVTIQVDVADGLMVQGDESKLRRVFSNLTANAVDALHDRKVANGKVSISANVAGNSVSIQVQDNGPGIPAEIQRTLFDPFVTKEKQKGTGLGLAIVKQFVVAHGGSIEVKNDPGAVFTLTLPL